LAKANYVSNNAVKDVVKQSNVSLLFIGKLSPTALKILEVYRNGGTSNDAAKQAHCTKQNVHYWNKRLITLGLIRLQFRDVFKFYSLTPLGQKCFTMSESNGEAVALEDYAMKFAIIRGEISPVDWVKLGKPNNWTKLGMYVGSVRVVRTSKSIVIHPGKVVGFNLEDLLFESGRIVQKVKDVLEMKFGMLLSAQGVPLHKPVTRFYSEEARDYVKNGRVVVEGVGSIDASPPEHIPHEEYTGIERAKARILLPDTVKRLRTEVYDLRVQSDLRTSETEKFLKCLKSEINELKHNNKELVKTNLELTATNIETIREVKTLSGQMKNLIDALRESEQKKQPPENNVMPPSSANQLSRVYE
jgi:hypothetical protein